MSKVILDHYVMNIYYFVTIKVVFLQTSGEFHVILIYNLSSFVIVDDTYKNDTPERILEHPNAIKEWYWLSTSYEYRPEWINVVGASGIRAFGKGSLAHLTSYVFQRPVLH